MGGFRIGRIAGVEILVHWSWLFIFFLLTWWLAGGFFQDLYPEWNDGQRWLAASLTSLLFFASVLLHELSHSLVALRRGIAVRSITLFIFGGVAALGEEPRRPRDEFIISAVGPLTSLSVAALFAAIALGFGFDDSPASAVAQYLAIINAAVAGFNLLPGFPLDGGRLLRACLWARQGSLLKATRWASRVGSAIALALIAGGVAYMLAGTLVGGVWFILIGWFLRNASETSYRQALLRNVMEGTSVESVVSRDYRAVPPDITLSVVVRDYMLAYSQRAFPVMRQEELLGLLTLADLNKLPQERWPYATADQVMTPSQGLLTVGPQDDLHKAMQLMSSRDVHQLLVVEDGKLIGFVTRADILRLMQIRLELGGKAPRG